MKMVLRFALFAACMAAVTALDAQQPWQSGLQPGVRPGPYSSICATGPNRGISHCFICETGDKPAVILFARAVSEPLGKLANGVEKAVAKHKDAELRAWVTILDNDQPGVDPKIVQWSRKHALASVPVAVFEDAGGPPSYKLARDADVTVLLFVKQKVVANFAFRAGELTDARMEEVLKAIPELVKK